jgi:hypothetical protein
MGGFAPVFAPFLAPVWVYLQTTPLFGLASTLLAMRPGLRRWAVLLRCGLVQVPRRRHSAPMTGDAGDARRGRLRADACNIPTRFLSSTFRISGGQT